MQTVADYQSFEGDPDDILQEWGRDFYTATVLLREHGLTGLILEAREDTPEMVIAKSAFRGAYHSNVAGVIPVLRSTVFDAERREGVRECLQELVSMVASKLGIIDSPGGEASTEVLSERQREVLSILSGVALTLKELAKRLDCDPSRLHREHLKALMRFGRVENNRKIGGYYRPDTPPVS